MTVLRPAEYPADRTAGRWVLDALVSAFALVTALPSVIHSGVYHRGVVVVVLALLVGPLIVRRIWPVPVFAWVLATAAAAGLWDSHLVPGVAVLIAMYTVAAMRPRRDALAAAAAFELATIAAAVRFAGGAWWFDAIFLSGLVAAALGLGLYSATRRAYLAELRDRAERLERERDQQGALAAAAERARIAREMHDIVAHHLTVMVTLSDGAVAAAATSPEQATDVMRSVSATGRRALADTRRLLGVLREPPGGDPGDGRQPVPDLASLDGLIEQVRSAGLAITLEIRGPMTAIPSGVQLTAYRLVQEALTNTLKHAGRGARAAVRLHAGPGELGVEITDDGAGGIPAPPASPGGGLIGMRERVLAYGGDVLAGPRPPAGWAVTARLPTGGGEAPENRPT